MAIVVERKYNFSAERNFFVFRDGEEDFNKRRKKDIDFHVEVDDYFGTLATVISLMRQEKQKMEERHNALLERLKEDLVYLQKNYKISRK